MVKEYTEELRLDDGTRRITFDPKSQERPVVEVARHYTFHLRRKQAMFGDVPVDQWWMKRNTLYGDRRTKAVNHLVIVEYWWSLCRKHATVFRTPIQETHILAKLLPHARSNGARRVFGDAVPGRRSAGMTTQQVVAELDNLLVRSRTEEIDKEAFRNKTADCLGPPEYEPEAWQVYRQLTRGFFTTRWGR